MDSLFIFLSLFCTSYANYYDSFRGTVLTEREMQSYVDSNLTLRCTNYIRPCDPNQGRRIDGSCNNLDHPSRGSVNTPTLRLLPPRFSREFEPATAQSGNDLPGARRLRTELLFTGDSPSQIFTDLAVHLSLFFFDDVMSNQDTLSYVFDINCCTPEGQDNPQCVPNAIPDDDPVHRFTNHRCLNMTRPITFQSLGCMVGSNNVPTKTGYVTPLPDLSMIYGSSEEVSNHVRMFEGGLLRFDMLNGKEWPPTFSPEDAATVCVNNRGPNETRCHDFPDIVVNSFVGPNLFFIWFLRNHNEIARQLARLNDCWSDQRLFETAREINIATSLQIYFYEMWPVFLGRKNLEKDKVLLAKENRFRDIYDKRVMPQLSTDYVYALRYQHTIQAGHLRLFDANGTYIDKVPTVDVSFRTGFLADGNNMAHMTQGAFRQGGKEANDAIAPEFSERALEGVQQVSDATTNDLAKGRHHFLQTYIEYRKHFFNDKISKWDDLRGIIAPQKIERLSYAYESVQDVDLLVGIWLEDLMNGGNSPPTFYKIVVDQLIRFIRSDRHWYERGNRPNAFTLAQLREIRKASVARLLCDVGDSVTEIQPNAFERIGNRNRITSCRNINRIDYSVFRDRTSTRPCLE